MTISATGHAEELLFSDPLAWDANFVLDSRWSTIEISPGNKRDSEEMRYREEFSFKKRFHVLDPGIATFSFDIRPQFNQTDYVNIDNTSSESNSSTLNYSANSSFLHGAKVPLSLSAGTGKTTGETDGSLGSYTDFDSKTNRATLNFKNTYFPSSITFTSREQELVQSSGFLATPTTTHDKSQRWDYHGRTEQLTLNIEQLIYDDFIYNRHYTYSQKYLNHTFSWDTDSRLNSQARQTEQKDFGAYSTTFINETAHIQHTPHTSTDVRYNYNHTQRTYDNTAHQAYINFNHKPLPELNTSIGYQRRVNTYSSGDQSEIAGPKYSIGYQKDLPFQNSSFAMGFNGSDLEQGAEWIDVIDQSYTVSGPGDITLNERFIDIASIIITGDNGNIYVEGIGNDYTITQSNNITIINIPVTTTIPFALPGDPPTVILISYTYNTPASETHNRGYYMRFNLDNVQLYYSLSENDHTFLPPASEASHNREQSSGIQYNLKRDRFYLRLGLDTRYSRLDQYWSRSQILKQDLSYILTPLMLFSLNTNINSTDTTLSDSSSVNIKTAINIRFPQKQMTVSPYLIYWQRDDNIGNDDSYMNEGVEFNRRYHLITFKANFDYKQWSGTTRNNDEYRIMFTLTRRSK